MSVPPDPADDKKGLREAARKLRDRLTPEKRSSAARGVSEAGLNLMERLHARTIAGYHPFSGELDVMPLLSALHETGYALALPVTPNEKGPLVFRQWVPSDQLVTGRFGILEPLVQKTDLAPDTILLPMLAFDKTGHRLGYGGGYYDRTLRSLRASKSIVAVGIAFDEQEIDRLRYEDHDEALDWLLTPSGARRFGT